MKKKFSILLFLLCISFLGISQVTDGLIAYYSFNGNAVDSSGNGNNAIPEGNSTVNGSLAIPFDDISYLSIPHTVMNQLQDFSIAMWVKFNQFHIGSGSHYNTMMSGENNQKSGGDNFGLYYQKYYTGPGGAWQIWLQDDYYLESTDTISPLQWYFVVFIRQGSVALLYKNGLFRTSASSVYSSPLLIEPNGLIVGQEQDEVGGLFNLNQCLDGNIGKLRIYDRALTPSEVAILYNYPVGVDYLSSRQFSIYPNPTQGTLTVSDLPSSVPYQLEIYNSDGIRVRSAAQNGSISTYTFDLRDVGSGLYFIRIQTGSQWHTAKFLVIK